MNSRLKTVARVGFVAKGIVYSITGVLVLLAAVNMGGSTPSKMEVLDFLKEQPFGQGILVVMGLGLLAYVTWRMLEVFKDPEDIGSDAKGIGKRAGLFLSGLLYLGLAAVALKEGFALSVFDDGNGGGNGGGTEAAKDAPFLATLTGRILLGVVGGIVAGVGGFRFVRAFKSSFTKKFNLHSMSDEKRRKSIKSTAKFGMSARGAIYVIMGFFAIKGAVTADPDEIKNSADVFSFVQESSYGAWLLGFIGAGLIAYAAYMFLTAKYRKFRD